MIFGHRTIRRDGKLLWADTQTEATVKAYTLEGRPIFDMEGRTCAKCNQAPTAEGHDPCIANLPGVAFACCGHGKNLGYVKFKNGTIIRGVFASKGQPKPLRI